MRSRTTPGTLTGRSAELVAYLTASTRPAPALVLFVSKRLDVVELPAGVVEGVAVFWRGDRPCYRLTPAVLVWVEVQAERHKDKPAVAALAAEFGQWVSAYYPPHQIRAARIRRSPLPDVKPPPTCPGADEWAKVLPQYQQKGPE
jgi:hypothetical protein